jgi:hypothetical protein
MVLTFATYAYTPQKAMAMDSKTSKSKQILKRDSSTITQRKFDENAIKKYRSQREFNYDNVAPNDESLWSRFWRWFWALINDLFSGRVTGNIIKYLLTAIVMGLIVFITIKLIGLDYKLFTKKSKTIVVPFEESLENIHEIDFDKQIENAISSLNYRLAVRLLYLKTLKRLSDNELIIWQAEKTNQNYVIELKDHDQQKDFAALTYQFEYIWYGDFVIDKLSFEALNYSFDQFNLKLR